jgi:hypothetical protein
MELDWDELLAEAGDDQVDLLGLYSVAEEALKASPLDNDRAAYVQLCGRIASRFDWAAILPIYANDYDELLYLHTLARRHADAGTVKKIEALGRAARKRADRLAAEAGATPATPASPTVLAPATGAPSPAARSAAQLGEGKRPSTQRQNRTAQTFAVGDAEELHDFAAAIRKRSGLADVTDTEAAAALDAWHAAMRVEDQPLLFVSSAGWTGICLARWLAKRYAGSIPTPTELPADSRVWELTRSRQMLRVLSWVDPATTPAVGQWITELDINSQYLAAARSALLGDGEPIELDAQEVAGWNQIELTKQPGYVVLGEAPDLTGKPSHVRGAFARVEAGWILPTPLAAYLVRDHGVTLTITEAIIWHTRVEHDKRTGQDRTVRCYGKRLTRWAETIADGLAKLIALGHGQDDHHPANLAAAVTKSVYTKTLGAFLRSPKHNPSQWLRPDWYDMIVAQASANMLRSLDKAADHGWHAIGGLKDSVWFVADTARIAPEGMTVVTDGTRPPGRWKHNRWCEVDTDIVSAHRSGRAQLLRTKISAADERRRVQEAA